MGMNDGDKANERGKEPRGDRSIDMSHPYLSTRISQNDGWGGVPLGDSSERLEESED